MPNRRPRRSGHLGSSQTALTGYLLSSRVRRSTQNKVAAKAPKAAVMSAITMISDGIEMISLRSRRILQGNPHYPFRALERI